MTTGDQAPDEAGALQSAAEDAATRCGFVALIGAPNAGKSTLINKAVGTKVSIVSRKVQTTRALVRGIASKVPHKSSSSIRPACSRRSGGSTARWCNGVERGGRCRRCRLARRCTQGRRRGDPGDHRGARQDRRAQSSHPQQDRYDRVREAARTLREPEQDGPVRRHVHDLGLERAWRAPGCRALGRVYAAWSLALPGRSGLRCADPGARGRDTREKLFERLHDELPYQSTVETELWKEQPNGPSASSRPSMSRAMVTRRS